MLPTNNDWEYPNLKKACVPFRLSENARHWLIAIAVYIISTAGSIVMFRHINNCPNYQNNENLNKFPVAGQVFLSFTPIANTLNLGVVFIIDRCVHIGDSASLKQLFKMN